MDVEASLRERFSEEELNRKIDEYYDQFHGLLTREAALKLIAKETGIGKKETREVAIGTIEAGAQNLLFSAKIVSIGAIKATAKGLTYRVIGIADTTGTAELVIWGKDCTVYQGLRVNDLIRIEQGYERMGRINISYKGSIAVTEKSRVTPIGKLVKGDSFHVEGTIVRVIEAGEQMITFALKDATGEVSARIEKDAKRASRIAPGRDIVLENVYYDGILMHVSENSRFFIRRIDGVAGVVQDLVVKENGVDFVLDSHTVNLNREDTLRTLGVGVRDDITLATVIDLIKETKKGKSMFVKTPRN